VRTFVAGLDGIDWRKLNEICAGMVAEGEALLAEERIPEADRQFHLSLDCRYLKQYHEVSFPVPFAAVEKRDVAAIEAAFHAEHNRMYGYSLEDQGTPVELINVRVQAVGLTEKPAYREDDYAGEDPAPARKGDRRLYVPERDGFRTVTVYDGHKTRFGYRIAGPALIEQVNTTIFLSEAYDCVCDRYGSFAIHAKGREDLVASALGEPRT